VQLIYNPPDPANPAADAIVAYVDSRFGTLNRSIQQSIQTYLQRFNEPGIGGSVAFRKLNELRVPDCRQMSDYLPSGPEERSRLRVVFDFVGGDVGIDFETAHDGITDISHLVGVSHSRRFELCGSSAGVDSIIYADLKGDTVFTILHDIALDIYFFHNYFDDLLGSRPPTSVLRQISSLKVNFARDKHLALYGLLVAKLQKPEDLSYVSFAATCRNSLSSQKLDFDAYHNIWLAFRRHYLSSTSRVSQPPPDDDDLLCELWTRQLCSLEAVGGQLSRARLMREMRKLLKRRRQHIADGGARESNIVTFVITTIRPHHEGKRRAVAALLGYRKWRKNLWCFRENAASRNLRRFLPYVKLFTLRFP
jgi:hypothetical protein